VFIKGGKGKGNFPQVEFLESRGKGFGIKDFQSFVRAGKRIQNPP
jgi:hypothetical protein